MSMELNLLKAQQVIGLPVGAVAFGSLKMEYLNITVVKKIVQDKQIDMDVKEPTLKEIIKGILLEYSENGNILYFHYDQVVEDIIDNIEAKSKEEAEERSKAAHHYLKEHPRSNEWDVTCDALRLAAFGKEEG